MKKGWDKYASQNRIKQKGYLRKYCKGSQIRKASEASSCDCLLRSKEKEEIETSIQYYGKVVLVTEQVVPNEPFEEYEQLALDIWSKSLKEVYGDESIREENVGETYQQGQQGIQVTTERGFQIEESNSSQTKEQKVKKKRKAKQT